MAACMRCGASYGYWNALGRKFSKVCDACLPRELQAQKDIESNGLPALAARYLPDETLKIVALAIWDSAFSKAESIAGKIGVMLLTGGFGSAASQHNAGLIGTTADEFLIVTLKMIDANENFDYRDLANLNCPAHFLKPSGGNLSTIKRAPLGQLTSNFKREDGYAVIQLGGALRYKLLLLDKLCADNAEAANRLVEAIPGGSANQKLGA